MGLDRKALRVRGMLYGLDEVRSVLEVRKKSSLPLSSDDIKGIIRFFIALARDDIEENNKIAEVEGSSDDLDVVREHYLGYIEGLESLLYRFERLRYGGIEPALRLIQDMEDEILRSFRKTSDL